MELPETAGFMILSGATLFPRQLLPLHIFEPRYRQMLADALEGDRMFGVAMKLDDGISGEEPHSVAGLGLIKVAVEQSDGTSNVILEGMKRVRLLERIDGPEYPCFNIDPVEPCIADEMAFKESMCHLYGLLSRFMDGDVLKGASGALSESLNADASLSEVVVKSLEVLKTKMESEEDPERLIDMITCTFMQHPAERQVVLGAETLDLRICHIINWMEDQLEDE